MGKVDVPDGDATQRDEKKQRRGSAVVDSVLEAALGELGRVGYGGLSIETVAERAGVNKTTVYRRWPSKQDLARAALLRVSEQSVPNPDTGAIRSDLIEMLSDFARFLSSHRGRSLFRGIMLESCEPEVAAVARSVREAREATPENVVTKAVLRRELPRGTQPRMILEPLLGAIQHRVVFMNEGVDRAHIESLVDLVLDGARHGAARRLRRAR